MASLCKRQQCTIERRGFRQELDSWRHKLIHCVGFESILEGLFGPGLVKDLTLFKDCEPEGVSDWSFDENCLFCCLRREKVKEHLVGFNDQALEAGEKTLCKQEQSKINRLEKQAEEFLNAVFYRKDIPRVSDPHIPLVAREIMQRMIRQFAAEYTSKTSSSQDPIQPNGTKHQSLPKAPSLAPAAAAAAAATSAQNPVLSKLLMADQDSPLDLTVKRTELESSDQDGVLDLSTKKSPSAGGSTSLSNSPGCSTAPVGKGDSEDLSLAKVKDRQTPSSLEQFMAKLCRHHQRQIVDALGFLQTEVKAAEVSSLPPPSASPKVTSETGCSPVFQLQNTGVPCTEQAISSPTGSVNDLLEVAAPKSAVSLPEPSCVNAGLKDTSSQVSNSSASNLHSLASAGGTDLKSLQSDRKERENIWQSGGLATVKSGSIPDSSPTVVSTLDELKCIFETPLHPNRKEQNLEELGPSLGRHDQCYTQIYHTERQCSSGDTKDMWDRPSPVKRTTKSRSPVSPKTARKSRRGPYPRPRDNQCDIVYISKPITECPLEPQKPVYSRGNARKSTRGHMYSEETWELKTVRTLAQKSGTNGKGNCPALMPDSITLVTPKQVTKPDSVPPVDIPFVGGCRETIGQKAPSKQLVVKEITGDVYAGATEAELIVETSQTGQQQLKDQTSPPLKALLTLVRQQSKESEQQQSKMFFDKNATGIVPIQNDTSTIEWSSENKEEKIQFQDFVKLVEVASIGESRPNIVLENVGQNSDRESHPEAISMSPLPASNDSVILEDKKTSNVSGTQENNQELQNAEADDLHLTNYVIASSESISEGEMQEQDTGKSTTVCCSDNYDGALPEEMHIPVEETVAVEEVAADATVVEETVLVEAVEETALKLELEENENGEKAELSTPDSLCSKRSTEDPAASDRCLRSKQRLCSSEMRLSRTQDNPSSSLHIPGIQDNPVSKTSRRSIDLKEAGLGRGLHKTLDSVNYLLSKQQSSLDVKSEESGVWTRQNHKSRLAKELEKDGELGHGSRASNHTGHSDTKKDGHLIQCSPNSKTNVVHRLMEGVESPALNNEIAGAYISEPSSENNLNEPITMLSPRENNCRRIVKPLTSAALMRHKKLVLRSHSLQHSAASSVSATKLERKSKHNSDNVKAVTEKSLQLQNKDFDLFGLKNLDLSVEDPPKFLEALTEEENQGLITNLNTKYDKMQKGWVQMDKEGQPAPKPKNKADRLKEIWKSKRRVRRPRALDQQKFSPVQMLFMKTFSLANICRWFLQTTETKSLVIVKKVNTRLPSETQLCFHNSSSAASSSHGVYPSSQAERLKKHLKKFAIASPAKNNLKNQKLIARARQEDGICSKGKEKVKELTTATRITTKPNSNHAGPKTQVIKNQKATQNAKSPASARILRKYSNIREKLQVQQHKLKTKGASRKDLKSTSMNPLLSPKLACKSQLAGLGKKKLVPSKGGNKDKNGGKPNKADPSSVNKRSKSSSSRLAHLNKNGREVKVSRKKNNSRPLGTLKPQKTAAAPAVVAKSQCKVVISPKDNKKIKRHSMQEVRALRGMQANASGTKGQKNRASDSTLSQKNKAAVIPSTSQDQVLTRSQRKMEAVSLESVGPQYPRKRGNDLKPKQAKRTRTSLFK
ncbi:uncharacterized protein lcor isoform X2 [Amia ocellicauda]|uniref:uncharacterized protein lcor isoform X2 n=1 Tax=Amia ocellicauda TaxID=2972642 RepID=UPI003464D476